MEMINEYENALRSIICILIGQQDDSAYGVTSERIQKWKEKREVDRLKSQGTQLETRLIYYSDFYDLETIIYKNWLKFKPIFNDKKRFEILHAEIELYRNTLAHGREILSFQLSLLKGIVGDLKNQILKYHSKNMNIDDYFIKILKVSDNFGNIWEHGDLHTKWIDQILRVGDTLEFVIDAFDPKGREIEFSILHNYSTVQFENSSDNRIIITLNKIMISKSAQLNIMVKTKDSEYENTDMVSFVYSVIP